MNERDKELATEAGMVYREFEDEFANANTDGVDQKTMQQFADLIRADERKKALAGERIRIGVRLDTLKTAIALLKAENTELKDELKVRGNT